MVKQKKKKVGRPKKAPTKIVRVPKSKPDFQTIASNDADIIDHGTFIGFVHGCNYVWDKFITKGKRTPTSLVSHVVGLIKKV